MSLRLSGATSLPPIDFERISGSVCLKSIIEQALGPPSRSGKWLCPFHEDRDPSLGLTPDGEHFVCWACNARGDALEWISRTSGTTVVEAAKQLDPSISPGAHGAGAGTKGTGATRFPVRQREAPPAEPAIWENAEWQAAVDRLVNLAEEQLWDPVGLPARMWLNARGLHNETIRRFRLGFLPKKWKSDPLEVLGDDDRGRPRSIWARRGITIPWIRPGSWYSATVDPDGADPGARWVGCNVRRLPLDVFGHLPPGEEKCYCLAGSSRGYLYPHGEILPTQGLLPALLCEGEFDALLANQEAGHIAHVATVGGANQTPRRNALASLARCPWWLLGFDHDQAGIKAAREWMKRAPHKSRRALLPFGKDITDYRLAGGDILAWLASEFVRLGWRDSGGERAWQNK